METLKTLADALKALEETATETTEPSIVFNGKIVSATLVKTFRGSKRKAVTLWKVDGKRVAIKNLMATLES